MGYLSSLLQRYATGDDATASEKPTSSPLPQSPSSTAKATSIPNVSSKPKSTLITAELEEKMRTNPRARAVRQLTLFAAGATFFTLSTLITRRAISRKLLATTPRTFTPSNFQPKNVNGAVEAAEAFALATLNVGSAAMMLTGGAMYALDITSVEDMREKFKERMGFQSSDVSVEDSDKEIEEWVQSILEKKDSGESKGIAESLTALVGVLAGREEDKEKLRKMHGSEKEGGVQEAEQDGDKKE